MSKIVEFILNLKPIKFVLNLKPVKFIMEKLSEKKDQSKEDAKTERDVYVTPNGTRYHYDLDCPSLRHARRIHKMSLRKAKKARLTPCDKCCYY